MRITSLCLLVKNQEILLAMKKRGFGAGKWNGVGGKVENGETIWDAALREMNEEIEVASSIEDLIDMGDIKFYFVKNPEFDQHMRIFLVRNWIGEPKETAEMRPQWFKLEDIPFSSMWVTDQFWLPKVLSGKRINASFYFKDSGETIEKQEIIEV